MPSKSEVQDDNSKIQALKGKPFWIWSKKKHAKKSKDCCCFNHIVGLPVKNGRAMPMFDYEKKIHDLLAKKGRKEKQKDKHLWVKKATGLGVTELLLRYMAWLCYRDDSCRGAQMCIVTGPNKELAKGLITRLKEICKDVEKLESKETVVVLNGCRIEAFPSHHLDAMRALARPAFILLDEADFFPPKEQKNARDVAERYIAKSDPYIVLVSTPNMPGGLYESIEKEAEAQCIYHRLHLDYKAGLNKIYTRAEIEKARKSPSFEREYNLKYGYGTGNIFPYQLVDACVMEYDPALQKGASDRVLAVDPAYGSSKFALVGIERLDEMLYVKEARQYERPSPAAMLEVVAEFARQYPTVLVDSAHPGLIRDLQEKGVDAQPVNFAKNLADMTSAAARVVTEKKVRIHPAFTDLQYQLKAAVYNDKGHPDKRKLSFDLGDCMLMLAYYCLRQDGLFMAEI
ncbi:DEAD/DEAH box helicase family protein [Nitrososphaera viennensis]|uniref:DEAD/DEAH box helicase family protein n=2 Tax=Nitrososphaera viennensis TaxID=1034015 RepID=A0A977NLI8_9ARCH|nr:DEAD/DEAH box helicase family protein [Nitrososphaera viennensis]AIC16936.1 putative terminase, large subunit [Nitrososphaera viennensis EN76]UVS68839.1 DEAD/DEAH box helicase family protein [Nitrososphaera viennensis]CBX88946.1 putative terminase, large subunit [Nitrososphaera phage Pro-Nvie1]